MAGAFDAFRYISYMRSRWRWIAVSCATATGLTIAVSLALPREYTATARIVIEPPAGTDLRAAVAVSPIYLESLKTYEQFADSDSLFHSAVERFALRALVGNRPIEALKKRVLRAGLLRNTRILEISATLPDPRKAQALAQFVAESTVDLSRSLVGEGDQDLLRAMERQQQEARDRLQATEAAWAELLAHEPVAELQAETENAGTLRANLDQQLSNVDLEIADAVERARAGGLDAGEARKEESNARARREQLRAQVETLNRRGLEREKLLSARFAHRDRLEAERKAGQTQLAAAETQLREARGSAPYRGERLKIIDPGIVPERPSSPNLPLNVAAAFLLGLILPVVWLTIAMSYGEQHAYRSFAKAIDE
jgi:polysaccharide biosynthesis transport protein